MAALVPLANGRQQGGEILQPLAVVVLGGMAGALVATLVVLPALYTIAHGSTTKGQPASPPIGLGVRGSLVRIQSSGWPRLSPRLRRIQSGMIRNRTSRASGCPARIISRRLDTAP